MPIHNADIAAVFEEIADLLDIQQANPFRIRAYRNAARIVAAMAREVRAMVTLGEDLTELPGIGDDLAAKMREIVATGSCRALKKLQAELPPAITELLHMPGLGPKRVRMLWHELDVQTPEQVARAARDGLIRDLPGFGAKTEANILQAIEAHLSKARRIKLATAAQYAGSLVAWLSAAHGVSRGSRWREVTAAAVRRSAISTSWSLPQTTVRSRPASSPTMRWPRCSRRGRRAPAWC